MRIMEEFIATHASMDSIERVMTDETMMRRWMSPAVQFIPLDGWQFEQGARWTLTLTGVGNVLRGNYIVQERRPGLILWAFNGFWEGFDAWHWMPIEGEPQPRTLIQNRIEYELRIPGLDLIWPLTIGPLMDWDAKLQMQRLQKVCEEAYHGTTHSSNDLQVA